nr:interferon-induced protein 44-like [Misgurnus anguillicaudatus]
MGGSESTQKERHSPVARQDDQPVRARSTTTDLQPTQKEEFEKPWRSTPWGEKESLEKNLREFPLSHPNVNYVRILLTGDVGAGKSSFINSINSAFQKRITTEALANSTSSKSFTKSYKTYYIKSGESILPFVFNDIMGLESIELEGAHPEDIVKALQGFLKEGYKFNPVSSVSVGDDGYRSDPTAQEQTYCLVYIIAADKVSMMYPEVIQKMQYIRAKASELDIPQIIIMTRVDESCELVKKDLRKIYTSKKIKVKMEECCNLVGVSMSNIFPVKNYHEEIDPDNDTDVLLLRALTQIVQIANDNLSRKYENVLNDGATNDV